MYTIKFNFSDSFDMKKYLSYQGGIFLRNGIHYTNKNSSSFQEKRWLIKK